MFECQVQGVVSRTNTLFLEGLGMLLGRGDFCFNIYFWLCWVSVAACRCSLVAVSGGSSLVEAMDFLLWWLLLLGPWALERGPSICGAWAKLPRSR